MTVGIGIGYGVHEFKVRGEARTAGDGIIPFRRTYMLRETAQRHVMARPAVLAKQLDSTGVW